MRALLLGTWVALALILYAIAFTPFNVKKWLLVAWIILLLVVFVIDFIKPSVIDFMPSKADRNNKAFTNAVKEIKSDDVVLNDITPF